MKFLLDENVPTSYQKKMKEAGYTDIISINDIGKGLPDHKVFETAFKGKRTIITIDRDFFEYKKKDNYGIISLSGKINKHCEALLKTLKQLEKDDRFPKDLKDSFIRVTVMGLEITYRKKGKFKTTKYKFKNT